MADRTITYLFRANASGLKRETDSAGRSVRGLGDRLGHADRQTSKVGQTARRVGSALGGAFAVVGVGRLIKESVQLEATFGRSMAQIRVATSATGREMRQLDSLAQKLGADTAFSANEAADAMLELAKGGLSPAQIQAGALKNTLTLATAGSLDLAVAGNTVVAAMGAFQLGARQSGVAVSALAGAANASSADVSGIAQALSQAGTSAHAAGMSVQETTAILAAFSDAGIRGSDAGTSLRTMLTRLVPQTASARGEMESLGLSFVKSNGEFVTGAQVAQRLQDAYRGMSAAERTKSLQTIFGADSQRAANVLINEGAAGVQKYLRQTSDLTQAQKLADAAMAGTAGALERMSGAIDTAKLQIGKGLAPVVVQVADKIGDLAASGDLEGWARGAGRGTQKFFEAVGPLVKTLGDLGKSALPGANEALRTTGEVLGIAVPLMTKAVSAFNSLPSSVKHIAIGGLLAGSLAKRIPGAPSLGKTVADTALGGVKRGVTPVFVTNPGFGAGGKLGAAATGAGAAAGTRSLLGKAGAVAAGLVALGILAKEIDKRTDEMKDVPIKDQPPTRSARGAAYTGMDFGDSAEKTLTVIEQLNFALGKTPKALDLGATSAGAFDSRLSALAAKNPEQAFRVLNRFSEKTGISLRHLGSVLPQTKAKLGNLSKTGQVVEGTMRTLTAASADFRTKLRSLPKDVRTKVTTPGAINSRKDVMSLKRQYDLTPKQVRTLMQISGVAKAIAEARQVRREIAAVADRTVYINVYRNFHGGAGPSRPNTSGGGDAEGGLIRGSGSATSDSIPRWLSNGEFVVRTAAVNKYGPEMLHQINAMRYANGGFADPGRAHASGVSRAARGGGGSGRLQLVVGGRVFDAYVRDVAGGVVDDAAEFVDTLARRGA